MFRKFTLLMALLLPAALLQASPVSPELAQSIARQHLLRAHTARHAAPGQVASPTLVYTSQSAEALSDYYVFNNSTQEGYVVVAGDDRAPCVLAYSDEGAFDPNDIPDGMRYMLDVYAQEIALLRRNGTLTSPAVRVPRETEVKPLLECNWNQNAPFNDACPTYVAEGKTLHCATGCAATATAQIMNFHKYPTHGIGSHTYECNVNGTDKQTLSADFEHTTYHWDYMLDDYNGEYSELQGSSVATLMYHIGVAADMVYGTNSSTSLFKMMNALRDHFGYNRQMRFCSRDAMTTNEWETLIYEELDKKHPILFGGQATNGAHAFVLDGYDTDGYVHINWGWGGRSNGYFMLTAMSPTYQGIGSFEGGYNMAQDMVIGICPSQGEPDPEPYFDVTIGSFEPSASQVRLGEKVPMIVRGVMPSGYGCPMTVNLDMLMFVTGPNGEDIEQDISDNCYRSRANLGTSIHYLETDLAQSPFAYTPSLTLPNGEYKLWLFYRCVDAGVNEYRVYSHNENVPAYIDAEVNDGVMYFSIPQVGCDLVVTDVDIPTPVGTQSHFTINATVYNNGNEYLDFINFVITQNGQTVSTTRGPRLALATGSESPTRTILTAPAIAGDYLLNVTDRDGKVIGGSYDLKVLQSSGYSLSLLKELSPTSYSMHNGNVSGSVQIANNGTGNFVGTIPYLILDRQDGIILLAGESSMVIIPAGQSTTVNIHSTFEGSQGVIYRMCLRAVDTPLEDFTVWGEAVPFMISYDTTTDIEGVNDEPVSVNVAHGVLKVSGAGRVAVYNTAGALVGTGNEMRLSGGIYIVVADGTAHKVVVR